MQVAKLQNNIVLEVIVSDTVQWCIDTFGGEWVRTYYNTPGKTLQVLGYLLPRQRQFLIPTTIPKLDIGCGLPLATAYAISKRWMQMDVGRKHNNLD